MVEKLSYSFASKSDLNIKMDIEGYRDDYYRMSLGQILFFSMKNYKLKTAQIIADSNERYSYTDLLRRCVRVALKLKQLGYGIGDVISSCTGGHKNECVPLISTLFIGAIPATFDPDLPTTDTIHLLKLVEPKVMFVSLTSLEWMEECIKNAGVNTKIVVFGNNSDYTRFIDYSQPSPDEETFFPSQIEDSKNTALIVFSSGTTGRPKGICLSHVTLMKNFDLNISLHKCHGHDEEKKTFINLSYSSLYWISGIGKILRNITEGLPTLICSTWDPARFWGIVEKYKVNCFFGNPHNMAEISENFEYAKSATSLKIIIIGGYKCHEQTVMALRRLLPDKIILQCYAQTEVCGLITMFDPSKPADLAMLFKKPTSCGRILDRWRWKVIDPDTGTESTTGQLWLKSDYLMNGYYKMDCSSRFDADGYMATGDVVNYDDEGCFYVVDRVKNIFKYKGIHISPTVLEDILCSHPGVKEAMVIGIPNPRYGDEALALVVLSADYVATAEEIREYVDARVSEPQKLRGGVRIIERLPRTPTGKVSKRMILGLIMSDETG